METKGTEAKDNKVVNAKIETKKRQSTSVTYTLRALNENARKLLELELITVNEKEIIANMVKTALEKYVA